MAVMSAGEEISIASVKVFIAAARDALAADPPDTEEARKQLSGARMILSMYGHQMAEVSIDEVMNGLHDGIACINGRSFVVKDLAANIFRYGPETGDLGSGPMPAGARFEQGLELKLTVRTKHD
jgi:hypothetical protein